MKKSLVFLLILTVFCTALAGCRSSQPAQTEPSTPAIASFVDIQWMLSTCDCTQTLYFRSNGDCSYTCACGNPVNDDDLCEGYRYDPATQTIYLQFSETTAQTVTEIAVKSCDGKTLQLDFNGELRTFYRAEEAPEQLDELTYGGETYVYLPFPKDIFFYALKESADCEEDQVVPIPHDKWKFVYQEGDLFVLEAHKDAAADYYGKDENYTWFVMIDDPNTEEPIAVPLSVTQEDLAYVYSMEGMKRETTLLFDDIEIFGSLVKTDKEGVISASASLAYSEGNWYWRSEIIDDSVDGWPEYVVKLPESIAQQITVRK